MNWTVIITIAAGVGAGALGSVLGLGGGVFLVPVLNKVVGLPFLAAATVSLFSVVGTSTSVSMLGPPATIVTPCTRLCSARTVSRSMW